MCDELHAPRATAAPGAGGPVLFSSQGRDQGYQGVTLCALFSGSCFMVPVSAVGPGCGREAVPRLKSSLSPPGSVRAPMAKKYPLFGPATSYTIGKPTPIMPQSSTSAATPAHPCPHRRHTRRSGFKKFVRERAKARPKQRRWAHYDDGSGDNSQCPRCDRPVIYQDQYHASPCAS